MHFFRRDHQQQNIQIALWNHIVVVLLMNEYPLLRQSPSSSLPNFLFCCLLVLLFNSHKFRFINKSKKKKTVEKNRDRRSKQKIKKILFDLHGSNKFLSNGISITMMSVNIEKKNGYRFVLLSHYLCIATTTIH